MGQAILFTNIDKPFNIGLYDLLNDFSNHDVHLYSPKKTKLTKKYKTTDVSIDKIKDSIILLCGYSNKFLGFDESNEIYYFARGTRLNNAELSLLSVIDTIVAISNLSAINISIQCAKLGINPRICRLIPWSEPSETETVSTATVYECQKAKLFSLPLRSFAKSPSYLNAWMCSNPSYLDMLYLMLLGKPVLVPDSPPYNEIIIDKFNGFLITSYNDVKKAISFTKKNRKFISENAKITIKTFLDPYKYVENMFRKEYSLSYDWPISADNNWIIREQILSAGKLDFYPKEFSSKFKEVRLNDIQDIFNFFLSKVFNDAYVFSPNVQDYSPDEILQIRRSINHLGDRILKIHFCLDSIPIQLSPFANKLSIISIEEGLKQTKI